MRVYRASACCLALAALLLADTFSPDDVQIIGDIDYGQSSPPVEYSSTPRYRAFVFTAMGGDKIEVTFKGEDRKAFVAIANGELKQLASATTRLAFTVPEKGPDAEAYYIVFRDTEDKPGRFTVALKKVDGPRVASGGH